jgi:hypothetical protein
MLVIALLFYILMVDADNQSIPASVILQKVVAGEPVDYNHVIVTGDLNFSKVGLQTVKGNFYLVSRQTCKVG